MLSYQAWERVDVCDPAIAKRVEANRQGLGEVPVEVVAGQVAAQQGLTLIHILAQREQFLSHVLRCFAGFSDKNGTS
jgi:hypothetical protein